MNAKFYSRGDIEIERLINLGEWNMFAVTYDYGLSSYSYFFNGEMVVNNVYYDNKKLYLKSSFKLFMGYFSAESWKPRTLRGVVKDLSIYSFKRLKIEELRLLYNMDDNKCP